MKSREDLFYSSISQSHWQLIFFTFQELLDSNRFGSSFFFSKEVFRYLVIYKSQLTLLFIDFSIIHSASVWAVDRHRFNCTNTDAKKIKSKGSALKIACTWQLYSVLSSDTNKANTHATWTQWMNENCKSKNQFIENVFNKYEYNVRVCDVPTHCVNELFIITFIFLFFHCSFCGCMEWMKDQLKY